MANDLPPLPPLPAPWDYVYVFDQWGGQHRSLRAASRNGRGPDKSEQVFTADQMRDFARAAVQAEREANAKLCEELATALDRHKWPTPDAMAAAIRARSTK